MAGLPGVWVARDASDNGTSPIGARLAMGGLLAHDGGSAFDVRLGVMYDGDGPVVSGAGDMSYNIRAAVFATAYSTANGPTLSANDGVVNVATTAAPGSNSRIDVVWVRQNLLAADGGSGTVNTLEFGVVQGVAGASPAVPATPTGAVSLAAVTVAAGTTATTSCTFSQSHDWVVANGGIIPDGLGNGLVFDGTDWVPIGFADTGWQSIPLTSPWAGATAKYRVKAGICYLQGLAIRASGTATAVGTLPAGARPSAQMSLITRSSVSPITFAISTAGAIAVGSAYVNGDNLYFDNISFPVA